MYNSISIADYFINKSFSVGSTITTMKALKLVYISHGWYLGLSGKELITEQTEAWKYGPVVKSVYYAFKRYGSSDIDQLNFSTNEIKEDHSRIYKNPETLAFLDKIWEVYGTYTALELSALTHQKGSPWWTTWEQNNGSEKRGAIIPNNLIKQYYTEKADN